MDRSATGPCSALLRSTGESDGICSATEPDDGGGGTGATSHSPRAPPHGASHPGPASPRGHSAKGISWARLIFASAWRLSPVAQSPRRPALAQVALEAGGRPVVGTDRPRARGRAKVGGLPCSPRPVVEARLVISLRVIKGPGSPMSIRGDEQRERACAVEGRGGGGGPGASRADSESARCANCDAAGPVGCNVAGPVNSDAASLAGSHAAPRANRNAAMCECCQGGPAGRQLNESDEPTASSTPTCRPSNKQCRVCRVPASTPSSRRQPVTSPCEGPTRRVSQATLHRPGEQTTGRCWAFELASRACDVVAERVSARAAALNRVPATENTVGVLVTFFVDSQGAHASPPTGSIFW